MAKILKRIGTQPFKFSVELIIKSLEINVSDSEKCKCLLVFHRGSHKSETKKPVPIVSKRALFSETFRQTSTLYFHKKNKKFLPKPAQIDIILLFKEERKMAGFIKFDLASYPNKEVKNVYESFRIENSPDKNAKLNIEICISKIDSQNESVLTNQNLPKQQNKNCIQNPNKKNLKKKSESSESSSGESESESQDGSSQSDEKFDTKSENTRIKKKNLSPKKPSKPLLNNSEGVVVPNSLQKIPDRKNQINKSADDDQNLGISLDLFKTAEIKSRRLLETKKIDFAKVLTENPEIKLTSNMKSLLTSGVNSNSLEDKSQKTENLFDNNFLNKSSFTIKTEKELPEIEENNNISNNLDVSLLKMKQLENKLNSKNKELQILQINCQKLEKEILQLKEKNEAMNIQIKEKNNLIQSLQDQITLNNKTLENQINSYKSKLKVYEESNPHQKTSENTKHSKEIKLLQTRNQELESALKELHGQYTDLTNQYKSLLKDNEELTKLSKSKSKKEPPTDFSINSSPSNRKNTFFLRESYSNQNDSENKLLERDYEVKSLKTEILELKNKLKLKNLELNEQSFKNSFEPEIKQLKLTIELKDRTIKDLQEELKAKSQEKGEKNKNNEEFYKKKIEELTKEIFENKKTIEFLSCNQKMEKHEQENEVARLAVENQNLNKQIKELQNTLGKSKLLQNSIGEEDFKGKNKRQEYEAEINENNIKKLEKLLEDKKKELENFKEQMKKKEELFKNTEEILSSLQNEIISNKIKLGKILNAVFDIGGSELVDVIEKAIIE